MFKILMLSFLLWHTTASAVSFLLYAIDKRRAARSGARIRERTLHLTDLLGGWPGGLAARRKLRHKTRKQPFVTIFWCTVIAHVLTIILTMYLFSRSG